MTRTFATCLALVLILSFGGCGSDDEKQKSSGTTPATTSAETEAQTATEPATTQKPTATEPAKTVTQPGESQPGGAGDETPASSQALLTGKGGRIRPRKVEVPPFIAVRVELHAADTRTYRLRFGKRTVEAGTDVETASTLLTGLRPGERIVGRPIDGAGNTVVIVANAEPGP